MPRAQEWWTFSLFTKRPMDRFNVLLLGALLAALSFVQWEFYKLEQLKTSVVTKAEAAVLVDQISQAFNQQYQLINSLKEKKK